MLAEVADTGDAWGLVLWFGDGEDEEEVEWGFVELRPCTSGGPDAGLCAAPDAGHGAGHHGHGGDDGEDEEEEEEDEEEDDGDGDGHHGGPTHCGGEEDDE